MTNEKKMQLAALNAQGKSIEEISKVSGVNEADVEAFLATRGRTPETRDEKVHRLAAEGMMQKDIAEKLGISRASVCKILKKESFRLEETEKEPASVGTDTDSEVRISPNISTSYNTTETSRCQGLSGISGLSCLESALDEWLGLGQEAEIVSIEGDREKAYLRFLHDGQIYEMGFRRCRDV